MKKISILIGVLLVCSYLIPTSHANIARRNARLQNLQQHLQSVTPGTTSRRSPVLENPVGNRTLSNKPSTRLVERHTIRRRQAQLRGESSEAKRYSTRGIKRLSALGRRRSRNTTRTTVEDPSQLQRVLRGRFRSNTRTAIPVYHETTPTAGVRRPRSINQIQTRFRTRDRKTVRNSVSTERHKRYSGVRGGLRSTGE